MTIVPDAGEPLSPQAADLVRRIARVVLDESAELMAEVYAAVSAAADERCADTDAGALTEATAARPAVRVAVGPADAAPGAHEHERRS